MSLIIKRQGHKERFDERKLYGSIYSAVCSANFDERKCEKIADDVSKKVKRYLGRKKAVKSEEIRKKTHEHLLKYGKKLAFYYEKHLPNLKKL